MNKGNLLNSMFDDHNLDLKTVVPDVKDVFLCPICLREFPRSVIKSGEISDGHIWPSELRSRYPDSKIKGQRVLLCTRCNNRAGSHGDAQMGYLEKFRRQDEGTELYGERKVEILLGPSRKPIRLNTQVTRTGPTNVRLHFQRNPCDSSWQRNNPTEQARFLELYESDQVFNMLIHPPRMLKTELPRAGWITSAYLFAFFHFGYRYILHDCCNKVRQYILDSFELDDKELVFQESGTFSAKTCDCHFFNDPFLFVAVPLDGDTPIYLDIRFLDYQVFLPFHCDVEVLNARLYLELEEQGIDEEGIKELISLNSEPHIQVSCTKRDNHVCLWDFVLGRPLTDLLNDIEENQTTA